MFIVSHNGFMLNVVFLFESDFYFSSGKIMCTSNIGIITVLVW